MKLRTDVILDISIVISLEQIGPVLRGTTSSFLENSQKEAKVILYFTQRVVFTLGIGNQQVKFDKFHGPIELIDVPISQEVLLFPVKLVHKESPDPRVQKFGKDLIICIHYKTEDRSLIQNILDPIYTKLYKIINDIIPGNDYSYINDEEKSKAIAIKIKSILNRFIELRLESQNLGESLFNLGTLRQLDEKKRAIGSLLLGNLKGLNKIDLHENLGLDLGKKDFESALLDLIDMGYVVKTMLNNNKELIYKLS